MCETKGTNASNEEDIIGDNHIATSLDTPLREDAFERPDEEKLELVEHHFTQIMEILGLDLTDDSLKGTPKRVAKMYVKELFSGLNPENKPSATLFENKYDYNQMLVEKGVIFHTVCEHHFLPIIGKANVAYIANGQVIGLSKINRLVRYYARRPQVQERLTKQIVQGLKEALGTEHVGVVIEAKHMCVSARGVEDITSTTTTAEFAGDFLKEEVQKQFLSYISTDLIN